LGEACGGAGRTAVCEGGNAEAMGPQESKALLVGLALPLPPARGSKAARGEEVGPGPAGDALAGCRKGAPKPSSRGTGDRTLVPLPVAAAGPGAPRSPSRLSPPVLRPSLGGGASSPLEEPGGGASRPPPTAGGGGRGWVGSWL
jgi:hypothetical protein